MLRRDAIETAFEQTSGGYSPDRIVVDPDLNSAFIAKCRLLGMHEEIDKLNWELLNLRKSVGRKGKKTSKRTSFPGESEYRFAGEMAIRFLERRDQVAIDRILASPTLAAQFDEIASRIAPGFSPVQYRWAALNLRKLRRLTPELLSRVKPAIEVRSISVESLDLRQLPSIQGLYLFYDSKSALYAGETTNLRKRIEKHLDHSDNRGLARWLWDQGASLLHVEWHVLEKSTSTRVRKALEAELIESRRPLFNVQCVVSKSS